MKSVDDHEEATTDGAQDISGTVSDVVRRVDTEAHWQEHCGADSFKGICALEFYNSNALGGHTSGGGAIIRESLRSLGGTGAAYRLIAVDGFCQKSFAEHFEIETNKLPAIAVYSPSKRRYATFRGAADPVSSSIVC